MEVIDALIKNEERLNHLYMAYASSYQVFSEFWKEIAGEELQHAAWIRELKVSHGKGILGVDQDKFHAQAVHLFGDYLDQKIEEAKSGRITMDRALMVALDIEKSLIDKNWFKIFVPVDALDKEIIEKLNQAIIEHVKKVSQLIVRYQNS